MEHLESIIETTLQSFDFVYCIIVNILTYLIIRILEDRIKVTTWRKRLVLLGVIASIGVIYYLTGTPAKILLNSAILAPVFWSWVFKPICKHFKLDYKQIDVF